MKNSSKKLLLISVLLNYQLMYAEDDVKKLCNQEIKKEIIDKTLVDKYCYETAKEYENNKEYGGASWYYLLSHNDKYNITNLKKYISKDASVIYANIAHSYVLNSDIKNAKILYEEFLKVYENPNADTQDDYKILFKLYPDKKEQLNKGLTLWNEIYKPLLPIDELTKKYEEAKKSNNYKEAVLYLEKIIKIKEEVLGKEQPIIATIYNNIGLLYQNMNDYP
ncbi:tetratricopeptide repeat protein, partial [Aliarcobacter cryaerophilus]|uniref:tetratricopeptide repeat protein n=1 Tax=Aliarcobacter cryaerophilus TaxID=28198 RepID=UPI0021B58182